MRARFELFQVKVTMNSRGNKMREKVFFLFFSTVYFCKSFFQLPILNMYLDIFNLIPLGVGVKYCNEN